MIIDILGDMKYICSIYQDRPITCVNYPWNHANQIFKDCQFYDEKTKKLISVEEVLHHKSEKEMGDFCVSCGSCCFFGPAACSKLKIMDEDS
jgi:Fe-S-cluster containining protein